MTKRRPLNNRERDKERVDNKSTAEREILQVAFPSSVQTPRRRQSSHHREYEVCARGREISIRGNCPLHRARAIDIENRPVQIARFAKPLAIGADLIATTCIIGPLCARNALECTENILWLKSRRNDTSARDISCKRSDRTEVVKVDRRRRSLR